MQFALTPEQTQLKDAVDKFVRDRYGDNQRRAYRRQSRGFDRDNWRSLADMGLLALPFSLDDEGLGGGAREIVIVMEALGRGFAVEPFLDEILAGAGVLAALGQPEHKVAWLPRIMSGAAHVTLAHFEHTARFNLAHVRLRATSRPEGVVLDGEKSLVPLAAGCDQWIVSARERGESGDPQGIAFFLVPADAAGIERRDFSLTDGTHASALRFRHVTAGVRLRGRYAEFAGVIDRVRLGAGAEIVGVMSTLFESTVDYLRSRRQFGVPLASFQALQHRLADLYVLLEQSRSQLHRATLCSEDESQRERSVAGMKSYLSHAAVQLGEECVHLHGGIGTTDELALGHGYKRLLLLASWYGDADTELMRFCKLAV